MDYVYILHHCYERDDEEEVKLIGAFLSECEAEKAIYILKDKEGFVDFSVDCFTISKYKLNEIHWAEGFFST